MTPVQQQASPADVFKAFKERDIRALRKLNDRFVAAMALGFERKTYDLAIISYVLAKVLSKPRYWNRPNIAGYFSAIQAGLKAASDATKSGDEKKAVASIENVIGQIKNLDASDKRFTTDILTKARLKAATTIYAQGFSIGNASQATGVEKREIMSYAGRTMMFDRLKPEITINERLKKLRKILG
ncbi:hypothetical protein FJZ26_05375 [Candidatus Parvarchaeota archaeon]|nr:hypothetical protein [Candidatus Parvarchaeota archaeon]